MIYAVEFYWVCRLMGKNMLRAWIIWLLSAFFMCYKYAIEVSPGVMTLDLMSEFSLSGTAMGNLAASYFYAYLFCQIPAGLLIDRWGPRRVTTVAILLCASGTYLLSFANSFEVALLGRFIAGAGAAFAALNCLKLIANWFPVRQFALMAGLMMSVGMLGAVGGQAPLAHFISFLGWRHAMAILALVGLILAFFFAAIVRDSAAHHKRSALLPEAPRIAASLKSIVRNPQAWALSFYSGFAFAPVSAFGGLWAIPFLQEAYAFSSAGAARGASLIFIGFAIGAPLFGWISDRLEKRKLVMSLGTAAGGISLAMLLYLPQLPAYLVFILLLLFGFFISAFLLCFTMMKEIHAPILAATAIGFMNAFDALFGAFSDPLTGKVLDLYWTGEMIDGARIFPLAAYQWALAILVLYLGLSLIFLSKVKESYGKQSVPSSLP